MKKLNIVIFGATGSIGNSTLSIIKKNRNSLNIEGITCNSNLLQLQKIAKNYNVKKIGYNKKAIKFDSKLKFNGYEVFEDVANFHNMISFNTDIIIFAIGGLSPLKLLIEILKSGKTVGMANKECIITLGNKFNKLAKKHSTDIIPLDSEHNSIYHLLKPNFGKYRSITITATGGPFLKLNKKQLKNVTLKQAVKHPIWKMGKKISIDSATMMNKALEIIEAKYLFNLDEKQINAIIHPQAIIHALINFDSGISTAILNEPDMRIPISSLFFGFDKNSVSDKIFNLSNYPNLEFIPIDNQKYPAINLGYKVLKMGGIAPHVFNYLNELLVQLFIENKIKFIDIVKYNAINLERLFAKNSNITNPNLSDIKSINDWIDNNLYTGN